MRIIILWLFIFSTVGYAQNNSKTNIAKTAVKKSIIDTEGKIYMLGVSHLCKENPELHYAFLQALIEVKKMKFVICELSPSQAYYANKLQKSIDSLSIDLKNCSLYKSIIKYSENSIRLFGIDYEERGWLPFSAIYDIYRKKENMPPDIEATFILIDNIFKKRKLPNKREIFSICNQIENDIHLKEHIYIDCFKEDYLTLKRIIQGLIVGMNYPLSKKPYKNWVYREELMYSNINELLIKYPDEVFYGVFSYIHASKNDESTFYYDGCIAVANLLNSRDASRAKNNVITFIEYNMPIVETRDEAFYGGVLDIDIRRSLYNNTKEGFSMYKVSEIEDCSKDYSKYFDYLIIVKE